MGSQEEIKFSPINRDFAFILGFMTALALGKGCFLPFNFTPDMWSYLKSSSKYPENFFTRGETEYFKFCSGMTSDEFSEAFGYYSDDPDQRKKFLKNLFLPHAGLVNAFKAGFHVFMGTGELSPFMASQCNMAFSIDENAQWNFRQFLETVDLESKDDNFIFMLKSLPNASIVKVVQFITGLRRLPDINRGEDLISVVRSRDYDLPKAQNCTNQLILPANPARDEFSLGIILNYTHTYGFA